MAVLSPTHGFLACPVAYYSLRKSQGTKGTNFLIARTQVRNLVIRDQESVCLWGKEVESKLGGQKDQMLSLLCQGLGPGQSHFSLYHHWHVLTYHFGEFGNE